MKHIIIFCYILTILVGVSAVTIQTLGSNQNKVKSHKKLNIFMWTLLIMNIFDLFIYYNDYILMSINRGILLSIGDCIIAFLVYLWISAQQNFLHVENRRLEKITHGYMIIYYVVWILSWVFAWNSPWIRAIIDIPLISLLIIGSGYMLYQGVENNCIKVTIWYHVIVTSFMALTYGTYFLQESGLYNRLDFVDKGSIDLTIFFWFIINLANMVYYYKLDFCDGSTSHESDFNIDLVLDNLKNEYKLTKRELDLVREIFDGKTNAEIAEKLFISESTVKAHLYNIFKKMGVKNRMEVICIVRKNS